MLLEAFRVGADLLLGEVDQGGVAGGLLAIPCDGFGYGAGEIPTGLPAESVFCLVDGEAEERRFLEVLFLRDLFPRAGPVAQDFLDEIAHAAVGVGIGAEIESLGEARDFLRGFGLRALPRASRRAEDSR